MPDMLPLSPHSALSQHGVGNQARRFDSDDLEELEALVSSLPASNLHFTPSEVDRYLANMVSNHYSRISVQRPSTSSIPVPTTIRSASQCPNLKIPPAPCAFLRVGQQFEGEQRVRHGSKTERWRVVVSLQLVDLARGAVCGTMEALDVPDAAAPVTTFFEGDIVDNVNHSFAGSGDVDAPVASTRVDLLHWSKFPSFAPLARDVQRCGGRCASLHAHGAIYMRWKERFFVRGVESALTIAGFYYIALDRRSGDVAGLYYDPCSSPDQQLELSPRRTEAAGRAFADVQMA